MCRFPVLLKGEHENNRGTKIVARIFADAITNYFGIPDKQRILN
jgi:hypothetical protein